MDLDYGWLAALSVALLATGVVGGLLAGLLGGAMYRERA